MTLVNSHRFLLGPVILFLTKSAKDLNSDLFVKTSFIVLNNPVIPDLGFGSDFKKLDFDKSCGS